MPKASRGGRTKQAAQPTPQPAPQAVTGPTLTGPRNYQTFTQADANVMAAMENDDTTYDPSVVAARKMYISNTNFDGQGHSASQSLNYHLNNGVDFHKDTPKSIGVSANDFATMQYMDDYLQRGMHTLGKDAILHRGAHVDSLSQFGITDLNKYSEAQLKKMIVGQRGRFNSYVSASYDVKSNPFLGSGSGVSGGREVVYEIKTPGSTQVMLGSKKQTEVILNKYPSFTYTDVQFTGKTATPRLGRPQPQVKITIELD